MASWKDIQKEMLKNPAVKAEYDKLAPEFELASSIIQARIDKKLTQKELARKAGLSQVMIARLESGSSNPTFATITRVAGALGKELKLVGSNTA
jgi:DNA-binding XRE family transcriptional regulator